MENTGRTDNHFVILMTERNDDKLCPVSYIQLTKIEYNTCVTKYGMFLLYADLPNNSACRVIIGGPETYVYYNGKKYETESDYHKLMQIIERQNVESMLERM